MGDAPRLANVAPSGYGRCAAASKSCAEGINRGEIVAPQFFHSSNMEPLEKEMFKCGTTFLVVWYRLVWYHTTKWGMALVAPRLCGSFYHVITKGSVALRLFDSF